MAGMTIIEINSDSEHFLKCRTKDIFNDHLMNVCPEKLDKRQ